MRSYRCKAVLLTLTLLLGVTGVALSCYECVHAHGGGTGSLPWCGPLNWGDLALEEVYDGSCEYDATAGSCEEDAGTKQITFRMYECIWPYWRHIGYGPTVDASDCRDY